MFVRYYNIFGIGNILSDNLTTMKQIIITHSETDTKLLSILLAMTVVHCVLQDHEFLEESDPCESFLLRW